LSYYRTAAGRKLYCVRFEVFTAGITKNAVFWDAAPCRSYATDVPEYRIASIFRVEKSENEEPADFTQIFKVS
jgi:hypothetical protein